MNNKEAYDQGYIDGLTAYAWWGAQGLEVGTCGKSLKDAIEYMHKTYNYKPPKESTNE